MKQFEYKFQAAFRSANEEMLDVTLSALGKEGWEFIGIFYSYFIFKKELPQGPRFIIDTEKLHKHKEFFQRLVREAQRPGAIIPCTTEELKVLAEMKPFDILTITEDLKDDKQSNRAEATGPDNSSAGPQDPERDHSP